MGFKNWPYWIKGSLIALGSLIIILLIIYVKLSLIENDQFGDKGLGLAILFWMVVFISIPITIVGAISGFIYGRMENISFLFRIIISIIVFVLLSLAVWVTTIFLLTGEIRLA